MTDREIGQAWMVKRFGLPSASINIDMWPGRPAHGY